jgi:hypothetical protein
LNLFYSKKKQIGVSKEVRQKFNSDDDLQSFYLNENLAK